MVDSRRENPSETTGGKNQNLPARSKCCHNERLRSDRPILSELKAWVSVFRGESINGRCPY